MGIFKPTPGTKCTKCAPRIEGKSWAVLTQYSMLGPVHDCSDGARATSIVVSWHVSRAAAWRARNAYRRTHSHARTWLGKSMSPTSRPRTGSSLNNVPPKRPR